MRNCPYCSEEIQDTARFCKHCGRYVAQEPGVPSPAEPAAPAQPSYTPAAPVYPPAAPAQPGYPPAAPVYPPAAPAQPAYPPAAPAYPPAAPLYPGAYPPAVPAATPASSSLTTLMQQYMTKGYKILTTGADGAILERPGVEFNTVTFVILFIFVGIGALIYLLIFFLFLKRKAFRVQLIVQPDGRIQEIGDTLAVFDHDSLVRKQKQSLGWGIFFAVIAGIVILAVIIGLIASVSEGTDLSSALGGFAIIFFCMAVPSIAASVLLILQSKKVKQKLSPTPLQTF